MNYYIVFNSGSATLKVKIFESLSLSEVFGANLERVGLSSSFLEYQTNHKRYRINFASGLKDHRQALKEIVKVIPGNFYKKLALAGHRVVHGGREFTAPTLVTAMVLKKLHRYDDFAPIHNPINLRTLEEALKVLPRLKHYAFFDTMFFKDLPASSFLYGLPYKYYRSQQIRKYGFHGLSHEHMQEQAIKLLKKEKANLITCHLGGGCSLTAIKEGKVLDTSMGFTPLAGPLMASRSGDLDPAIPLYLISKLKLTANELIDQLNFQSGLKGICGFSDLREVLELAGVKVKGFSLTKKATKGQKALAKTALELFIYQLQKYLASYSGLLGKVEAVVFSGGIGERNEYIRQTLIRGVHFVNRPRIIIVKANEELVIASQLKKVR